MQLGDPRLKIATKAIVDFKDVYLRQVVDDLIDTMRKGDLVGMAAPQVGENLQVFVTELRETKTRTGYQTDTPRVFINPKIIEASEEEVLIYEGCGCVAKGTLFGPVKRPRIITIEAFNQDGKRFQLKCDGLLGRVIQHENDHLQGIEFTEKISDYSKLLYIDYYVETIRNSPEQLQASRITLKEYTDQ